MPSHACRVCGEPFIGAGQLCRRHRRSAPSRSQDEPYKDPAYRRLRTRLLAEWRRQHGDLCPGWRRPAHVDRDLTLDHRIPIRLGGSLLDESNIDVLCRSCNDRKRHAK